ncbi:MAG: metalloregulator ArsR/SmtB family transcription factor [Thermodesulfobacteriota bacterium]
MDRILAITRALADENRVRALTALRDGELCVCQIIELLDLAPSTVSKHMWVLRQAGLVKARKQGRWNYYRLPDEEVPEEIVTIVGWLLKSVAREKVIREDAARLKKLRRKHDQEQCRPARTTGKTGRKVVARSGPSRKSKS